MDDLQCKHIRIRDDNVYGINVEQCIKSIETKYKFDFRSLPQWKELVKRLHASTSDCKRLIQAANLRKLFIINKLFMQLTRNSPFELTERLARTHKKWQIINDLKRIKKSKLQYDLESQDYLKFEEELNETTETSLTMHPNTENLEAEVGSAEVPFKSTVESEMKITDPISYLPVNICVNNHKFLSPLDSRDLSLKANIISSKDKSCPSINSKSCMTINNVSLISSPKEIHVVKKTLTEQKAKFFITNCTKEYLFIRFLEIMNKSPFKQIKIIPSTQQKIYPGIAVSFKLIYQLVNYGEFTSAMTFKIGKNEKVEEFKVPIKSKFPLDRNVLVTETVYFAPVYMWQIRRDSGFPSAQVNVLVTGDCNYHLHIRKWAIDISHELQDSSVSMDWISERTESFAERIEDEDVVAHSQTLVPQKEVFLEAVNTSVNIIQVIVEDIIDLALDIFILSHTYINLEHKSEKKISLYFTKPVCIGSHHCYYNFNFYDTKTYEIISTSQVKVFAEVLPHPIQISPAILDMSLSPVVHGFCEDNIVITNTHKSYPALIKIKLTTKMKQLFRVYPLKVMIPALSSAKIAVKLCSDEAYEFEVIEDMAYFIFKIIVIGDKSIYKNVPPFFYELIAPCASHFKKVYSDKYFLNPQEPKEIC